MAGIKLMSWNIYIGLGCPTSWISQALKAASYLLTRKDRQEIPKIAKAVRRHSPDILTVQEIDRGSVRNGKYDQVKQLSILTGLEHHHFAVENGSLGYFNYGNAVLSLTKPIRTEDKTLPYSVERRNMIISEMRFGNKKVTVINTHLGAHNINRKERLKQAEAICETVSRIKMPVILVGDLNCEPESEEFRHLMKNSSLRPIEYGNTYPCHRPKNRFDHMMVSAGVKVKEAKVLDEKNSDHFPIIARLVI